MLNLGPLPTNAPTSPFLWEQRGEAGQGCEPEIRRNQSHMSSGLWHDKAPATRTQKLFYF